MADQTPLDLTAIQARANAATPGPWEADTPHAATASSGDPTAASLPTLRPNPTGSTDEQGRKRSVVFDVDRLDSEFIAAARTDVPALLAEIQRLRALVGEEGQLGWDGCDRAEAIRQAEESHAGRLQWIQRFDALRDQRDAEIERLQEELDGAHNSAWEMREHLKASREQGDRLRAEAAETRRQVAGEIATALERDAAEYPADSDAADVYRDAAREAREIGEQP